MGVGSQYSNLYGEKKKSEVQKEEGRGIPFAPMIMDKTKNWRTSLICVTESFPFPPSVGDGQLEQPNFSYWDKYYEIKGCKHYKKKTKKGNHQNLMQPIYWLYSAHTRDIIIYMICIRSEV